MFCWAGIDCHSVLSALIDDKSFTVSNPPSNINIVTEPSRLLPRWWGGRQDRGRGGTRGGRLCLILLLPYALYIDKIINTILMETALWKTWWLTTRKGKTLRFLARKSFKTVGVTPPHGALELVPTLPTGAMSHTLLTAWDFTSSDGGTTCSRCFGEAWLKTQPLPSAG